MAWPLSVGLLLALACQTGAPTYDAAEEIVSFNRSSTPELMDEPAADPGLLAESLRDLAWLNRYLGGTVTIIHQVSQLLDHYREKAFRVLDVGAGGGDILIALARWSARRGLSFEGVGLDRGPQTVRLAVASLEKFSQSIQVVRGDARALPFGEGAFDVALCNTFLHHLDPDGATAALQEMARVSRLGIVVSDLRRSRLGLLAAWTLARTVWRRHPYARHDGPASMRAAYTMHEARALAERAGLRPEVVPQPGFRWALRWRRSG